MGIMQGNPIPESYAGPAGMWWDPASTNATVIDRDMEETEVLTLAGINWTTSKRKVDYPATAQPETELGDIPEAEKRLSVPDFVALVRDSDDAYLGMGTPTYQLFQNHEGVAFVKNVLGLAGGGLRCHTAGSLYGGKLVWILAKFDEDLHVKGDGSPIESYFLALWGHDGRHALQAVNTEIRVWCGNTAGAALNGAAHKVKIRHTKNMGTRIEEVQRALDINFKYREVFGGAMNRLAERPMTIDELLAYTVELWPTNPEVEKPFQTLRKRESLVDLYRNSENLLDVPQNYYRAYQATVELLDHRLVARDTKKGSASDNRAASIIEGTVDTTKARALSLLLA